MHADTAPDTAPAASTLPPAGHDDAQYARPMAAPGLVSYRLRAPYGFVAIGAMHATGAMVQAALSTPDPKRDALEVWCDTAGAFVPAAPDHSEGAPVSRDAFWRVYAAHAAGLYAAGTLPPAKRMPPDMMPREAGFWLARCARIVVEATQAYATDGPVMRLTLKTFGVPRGRARALAFIERLAS